MPRASTISDPFNAVAEPRRRQILEFLAADERAVGEIADALEFEQPSVSKHLQVLRKARLVREEPRGRERYYHLNPRPLSEVEAWLGAFTHYWKQRLASLEELLEKEKE